MSQRSNIRDVSALAGVSVKTVSRVLNDHPYVSDATRKKVEEVAETLNSWGVKCIAYHGGMKEEDREATQNTWK